MAINKIVSSKHTQKFPLGGFHCNIDDQKKYKSKFRGEVTNV